MQTRSIRGWYLVHKRTSLICTVFLLMLCVTGLPLIFPRGRAAGNDHVGFGAPSRLTGGDP